MNFDDELAGIQPIKFLNENENVFEKYDYDVDVSNNRVCVYLSWIYKNLWWNLFNQIGNASTLFIGWFGLS